MELVKEVESMLSTIKDNVKQTRQILKAWESNLMFDRREGRVYTFEELKDSCNQLIQQRNSAIQEDGKKIVKLLSNSNRTLKVGKASPSWKSYVNYVSEIVIDGFAAAIIATIRYLHDQIDPEIVAKNETSPLLEIKLELVAPKIVWQPDLGDDGVRRMFNRWLNCFMSIGTLMKRLDIGEGK